jgi:DNA replicative helicase MCM subunit Mcm2 (Cdc46/Mcm family)
MWWYVCMALFGGRSRPDLLRWLKRGDVRLLLPADPGPGQMLEYVHLFDPRAKLAAHGSISVDGMREIYLSRGYPIEPDAAAEAGIPGGMGAAFFVTKTTRAQPFSWSDVQQKDKEQVDASFRLVRGLAVRLGGLAHPHDQPAVAEPLRATIYTSREISATEVREIAGRFAPGLTPYDNPTFGPVGVSFWRTGDGQLELSHWPRGTVAVLLPHEPRAVGDLFFHTNESTAVRLELSTPGNETDPHTARLLGECALEVAGAAGGLCVDQLGFRVTRPDDLVFG